MMRIPLGTQDYNRAVAKEARIQLENRYYEKNPVLSEDGVALLARPGMRRFKSVGNGPIRAVYSSAGSFDDSAFIVSENSLYRLKKDGTLTLISSSIVGTGLRTSVSMAATAPIGDDVPEYLFIADGQILWVYLENGFASGTLTAAGAIANGDVIRIDSIYYQWTSGSVNAGTPAGTLANPWLVALGASNSAALDNMRFAINDTGTPGTTYSTALTEHPTCLGSVTTATLLVVVSKTPGAASNTIVTTETGANISWGGATLAGGGSPSITQVPTPDDVGVVSLGYVGSYVICVPSQGENINGRFYWIQPGETTIDPLDFATAERAPDPIFQVIVFGDQFWLPGKSTTEVWYVTGDAANPMARLQGVTFDRGTWEGTAVQVKESMIIIDSEGGGFQIAGGLKRITTPDIEERIRLSMATQAADPLN